MDLRYLEYFQTVARSDSLTKAAGVLHITVPALSKIIKRLEEDVGFALFDRRQQGMVLTPAGAMFLKDINNIVGSLKKSIEDGKALSARDDKALVVAQCYGGTPLEIIRKFHTDHPEIKLNHYLYAPETIVQQLILEKVDLAILDRRFLDPKLNWTPLIREELLLGISKDHPYASRTAVKLSELTQFRFNCNSFMVPASYVEETGRKYGYTLDVCYEGNDFLTAKALSPTDMDVAVFLAASSVADFYHRDPEHFDDDTKVLRIVPSVFFRELGLVRYDEHLITEAEITYFDYVIDTYKQVNAQVEDLFTKHFAP